ncbi:hypothetical protein FRB93_003844 [Tulasnella sp. JGI-2019a]|nr:hypothetical protein FRB93_003844 [Tulasnella sp. JGI-2019a]
MMERLGPIPVADFKLAIWGDFEAREFLDDAKVQHRDISPENFTSTGSMNGRLCTKIIAFNLAAHTKGDARDHTTSKHKAGTLAFAAVDLLQHANCDHHLQFDYESLL